MQSFTTDIEGLKDIAADFRGGTILPGNFDGWHLGHQHLCDYAASIDKPPLIILTFEPHPRQFFSPDCDPFRLTSSSQKLLHMSEHAGVDGIVCLAFDKALASMSASDFIDRVLVGALSARHVVLGHDFHFGKGREGNADDIARVIETSTCEAHVESGGDIISSSGIRSAIKGGELGQVRDLLGRDYALSGEVIEGDRLGHKLGFATANLALTNELRPQRGVYITRACIDSDGVWRNSISNYGFRPTVDGVSERFETHIFDYDGDLYGRRIEVALLHHLRGEEKFADIEALRAQISADCQSARDYFANV